LEERSKPKGTIYPSKNGKLKDQIDEYLQDIDTFYVDDQQTKKEIKFSSDFTLRLFVEKNIRQKYNQKMKWDYTFLENKERIMNLTKIDISNQISDLQVLEREIGFSRLIWHLAKSQKLIVGHNMLTDIMQMMRQFFSSTLPSKYDDFKSMTTSLFPNIIDTKYVASVQPLKDIISNTALGEMDKILAKEPFQKFPIENNQYSTKNEKLHEAGYDAFLTGVCYLRMLHYLESFNSSKSALINFYSNKYSFFRYPLFFLS
jgi:poly(A)-specific ribonuclease